MSTTIPVDYAGTNFLSFSADDADVTVEITNATPNITIGFVVFQSAQGNIDNLTVVFDDVNLTGQWVDGAPDLSSVQNFSVYAKHVTEDSTVYLSFDSFFPLVNRGIDIETINPGIDIVFTERISHNEVLLYELIANQYEYLSLSTSFLNRPISLPPMTNNNLSGYLQQIWIDNTLNVDGAETDFTDELNSELSNARDLRI